jgi:hypothetical protein
MDGINEVLVSATKDFGPARRGVEVAGKMNFDRETFTGSYTDWTT